MTFLDGNGLKQLEAIARCVRYNAVRPKRAPRRRIVATERWPQHRAYAPGDDYRQIDWNACARHDELWFRPVPPLDDRPWYLLIDCSRSMTTGRPSKWDRAVRIAAGLAAAALGRLDRVGLLGFADGVMAAFPPRRGPALCLKLAKFLGQLQPEGKRADLAAASARLAIWGSPGRTIVIGDFLAPDGYRRGLHTLRRLGHAVCAIHLCHREDAQPNLRGAVALCDIETGDRLATVLDQRDLAAYRATFDAFCKTVHSFCERQGIAYHRCWEDVPWQETVFAAMGLGVK